MRRTLTCLATLGLGLSMFIGLAATATAAPAPAPIDNPYFISPKECTDGGGVVKRNPYGSHTCQGGKHNGRLVEY